MLDAENALRGAREVCYEHSKTGNERAPCKFFESIAWCLYLADESSSAKKATCSLPAHQPFTSAFCSYHQELQEVRPFFLQARTPSEVAVALAYPLRMIGRY